MGEKIYTSWIYWVIYYIQIYFNKFFCDILCAIKDYIRVWLDSWCCTCYCRIPVFLLLFFFCVCRKMCKRNLVLTNRYKINQREKSLIVMNILLCSFFKCMDEVSEQLKIVQCFALLFFLWKLSGNEAICIT